MADFSTFDATNNVIFRKAVDENMIRTMEKSGVLKGIQRNQSGFKMIANVKSSF